MRVQPIYTEQFKADAVEALRRSDRSAEQVARDLGISPPSLREWYRREEMTKKSKSSSKRSAGKAREMVLAEESPEQRLERLERENVALRKEVESLKMDREILKKAAAFFVKESE
jgi:transposase